MKTAIEYLLEQLDIKKDGWNNDVINKAKEMEKEQIIKAHDFGYINDWVVDGYDGEQYYNETFKE